MPCSKPAPSPLCVIRLPVTVAPVLFSSTPSPLKRSPSCPLLLTSDALSVVERAALMSKRPARALLMRRERVTVTAAPPLIWMPTPRSFATVARSIRMRLASSIQTACGAEARTVKPRRTTSWTPVSITLIVPAAATIVTGPSACQVIG